LSDARGFLNGIAKVETKHPEGPDFSRRVDGEDEVCEMFSGA
jgi:hypothetical protein